MFTGSTDAVTDNEFLDAQLVILEACCTTREEMNARALSELRQLPGFKHLPDEVIKKLLRRLVRAELLWRPPHLVTRSARYVTTLEGRAFIAKYRQNGSD